MSRHMKRGYKQNHMRHIWKTIKKFYEIANDYNEFTDLCYSFYYSDASKDVDGYQEYLRIIRAVGACR